MIEEDIRNVHEKHRACVLCMQIIIEISKDKKHLVLAAKYFRYFRLSNEIKSRFVFICKTANRNSARVKAGETQNAVPKTSRTSQLIEARTQSWA